MAVATGIYRPVVKVDLHGRYAGEESRMTGKPTYGIVHTTEGHNRPGIGDIVDVADYLDQINLEIHAILDREASFGMSLDPDRRKLLDLRRYDHAKGMSNKAIGIELIGFARTTRPEWWAECAQQLEALARFMAYCRADDAIDLPLVYLGRGPGTTPKAGRGWVGHVDISGPGGHWDPGPGFPLKFVIETMAKAYYQRGWTAGGNAVLVEKRP